jgi:2-iminobutanoate/2-iminopropanoate deaminase
MAASVVVDPNLAPPIGPYSYAVRAGHLVFLGGTPGTTAEGRMAGESPGCGDLTAQTVEAIACARRAVERAGGRWESLLRLNVFLEDWKRPGEFEEAYGRLVPAPGPARTLVGYRLAQDSMLVEIEGVASVDSVLDLSAAAGLKGRRIGPLVFLDGCLPLDATGQLAGRGEFAQQATVVCDRLEHALAAAGMGPADVIRLRAALADVRDRPVWDTVLAARFGSAACATAAAGASLPVEGTLVMAEVTAASGPKRPVGRMGNAEFPQAVAAGDLVIVSGLQSLDAEGRVLHPGDVARQTEEVLGRLEAVLAGAGLGLADVVQTQVTLADFRSYAAYNAVYASHFRPPYPARSTVQAQLGGPGQQGLAILFEATAAFGAASSATVVTAAHSFFQHTVSDDGRSRCREP